MEQHFDVSRIIGIKIIDKRLSSYKWLPEKQKTTFFGLIKRNSYHSEGYYSNGHYQECYESGCWDACPSSRVDVLRSGYLIDSDNVVWHRPYATVYLESDRQVDKNFTTFEEAMQWADELKMTSGKTFEIVKYD
jgi:hypothetical protein